MPRRFEIAIPIAIGLIAFFFVTGGKIILPGNIAWLASGDPQQHYLGWAFFREAPWTFPMGLNPRFGLELGSAITFSDSLPLLAIPFKALNGLLPPIFQYFGIWALICFVLQSVFAWKLCGFLTEDRVVRAAMTGFFVCAPPMLWRLHGHLSLIGHFLLLAALYLTFAGRERRQGGAFLLLVATAAAVHAYLLAMVAAIWLASLADGLLRGDFRRRRAVIEVLLGLALTTLVCWQVGYFSVGGSVSSGGYGFYRMNLLSIINPDDWSWWLPSIPVGEGDYEGFNYLGLGVILLALASLPAFGSGFRLLGRHASARPALMLLAMALTLFALSNVVGVASRDFTLVIPSFAERIANVFRSSGRMFWPVYYLLILAILLLFVRAYGDRQARWVLPLALIAQITDTSAGWTFRDAQLLREASDRWATPFHDPFWAQAAQRYAAVRWVMPENHSPHWSEISAFAVTHGLSTDATFLARIDSTDLKVSRANAMRHLVSGRYDSQAFYLLDDQSARIATDSLPSDTLLATIDGFTVLAPGWRDCASCSQDYDLDRNTIYAPLRLGREIGLGLGENAERYLTAGWGLPEGWGVWSGDDVVRLDFAEALPLRFRLTLGAQAFGPNRERDFLLSAGGASVAFRVSEGLTPVSIDVETAFPTNRLEISVPQAVSPRDLGLNDDTRRLGIGVSTLRIDPLDAIAP